MTAGRVGRSHGLDGSFRVGDPQHPLGRGTRVWVGDSDHTVAARRGSGDSPIVRLDGVRDREGAIALHGLLLLVAEEDLPLEEGEWLAADLIGCRVPGLGAVERVIDGPSCDVLELTGGTLVPLIGDAVASVDLDARVVTVHRGFLGLGEADPS